VEICKINAGRARGWHLKGSYRPRYSCTTSRKWAYGGRSSSSESSSIGSSLDFTTSLDLVVSLQCHYDIFVYVMCSNWIGLSRNVFEICSFNGNLGGHNLKMTLMSTVLHVWGRHFLCDLIGLLGWFVDFSHLSVVMDLDF